MRELLVTCLVLFVSSFGCGDSETPVLPVGDTPEIVMTVVIDSCDGALDSLCGRSSVVTISPAFVYPDPYVDGDSYKEFRTGPADWHFSDPHFRAALLEHFDGRSLAVRVWRTVGADPGESEISIFAISGHAEPGRVVSYLIGLHGLSDAALDSDGYPIIDTIDLKGSIHILFTGGRGAASGRGAAEMRLSHLPIEADREPPIVTRPDLSPEELKAAPPVLEFGEKTLVFTGAFATRGHSGGNPVVLGVHIYEEDFFFFDEVRMDFVWVVHESGVCEPENEYVNSIWNTHHFEAHSGYGPSWPVGTDVDIVVGFVDMDGNVHLMKATTTINESF